MVPTVAAEVWQNSSNSDPQDMSIGAGKRWKPKCGCVTDWWDVWSGLLGTPPVQLGAVADDGEFAVLGDAEVDGL
jgi:hypothetical protein